VCFSDVNKTFLSRPRPRPRPTLYFFVLEAPRDQDFGLEDYITGVFAVWDYLCVLLLDVFVV